MTANFSANSTNLWDEKTVPYDSQLTQKNILLRKAFLPPFQPHAFRQNDDITMITISIITIILKLVNTEQFLLFTYRFDFDSTHLLLVVIDFLSSPLMDLKFQRISDKSS